MLPLDRRGSFRHPNVFRQIQRCRIFQVSPPDSEERELLTKLLIQKDYPLRIEEETSSLRKQTTKHLLQYLNTHSGDFTDRRFVYNCYDTHGSINSEKDECLMGWYYYQFNEFWHFSNTSILNGTLAYLDKAAGAKWMPIQQLVTDVANGVIQLLIEKKYAESENDGVSTLLENISELDEYSCFEETSKNKLFEKVSNAFLLLLVLYIKNKSQLVELKEYSENNELAKDGEGSGYFITQFEAHKQSNIFKFIYEYIYVNIIYRHQYVAFRKIRNGKQSTQKFIIEDMHIRYLGNFEATYTGPRVGNLFSFLSDLNIISKENSLTEEGKTLLNTLIEE